MTAIKDILVLDLNEDIKSVIDLQNISETEVQAEIETYIVTDGLGAHLSKFITQYTSNIKETGVWLSGFYGSGKSYFGKMLGYLIDNPLLNGTAARERFIQRLKGVNNESLIENAIRNLDAINSKVVFLDSAKQNTENGLAFTLFANFLKKLGFRQDVYGYMEYDLFIEGKYAFLQEKSQTLFGKDWTEIKKSNREVAKAMRRIFMEMDYSEVEYQDTKQTYEKAIDTFSSSRFKDELEKYLVKLPNETIVFIFDEASEAISQKKFSLLDLEAISESLSSISKKVWTIAIAQEKLDDVINNANVSKANLTKVTDRFKTKIHLESTEVDVIIRNRLLLKTEEGEAKLLKYYQDNEGLVSDVTNLKSVFPTKTKDSNQFATYYPFHQYQFEILQKFLFSSNALAATQIAARGMIITTFDVLRKELQDRQLFDFVTAHDLCAEAQTAPPADLINKYSNAKSILNASKWNIDGEKLLKSIHFMNESELTSPTLENITKTYIKDIGSYYDYKPGIEESLKLLVEAKILLLASGNYKITSNLEGKLLEEMNNFEVELFIKKRELVAYLKKMPPLKNIAAVSDDGVTYDFNVLTDLDDELFGAKSKKMKLRVYGLFNMNEDRSDFVEGVKFDTQYSKDLISLIPSINHFEEVDRLIAEIRRYGYMEEKYSNDDDSNVRQIIREFSTIRNEKEKHLIALIQEAYTNSSLVYMFDENLMNTDTFKGIINDTQKKLIKNIYTKRLKNQLLESVGEKILKEHKNDRLYRYFSGDEFKFFDANGNFVGDHLKVVEEIKNQLGNKFMDGQSLENELSNAPWGFSYGTISTTLAVLFRSGRLIVKTNETDYFSFKDRSALEVFSSGMRFKKARFKVISKSLTAAQKDLIVQLLLDLDYEKYTNEKVDWSSSDFDLANSISRLAEYFISALASLSASQRDFSIMFTKVMEQKAVLQKYSAKTTESNYIQKAEDFIANKEEYISAVKLIIKAQKFIKRNLDKLKTYKRYVEEIKIELAKAGINNSLIKEKSQLLLEAISKDVIEHFPEIESAAQAIRDSYYQLMVDNTAKMTALYSGLKVKVEAAQEDLKKNYPADLNKTARHKLEALLAYCQSRMFDTVDLGFQLMCKNSHFSLAEILNYRALINTKETELQLIIGNFLKEKPVEPSPDQPEGPKKPKKIKLIVDKKIMKTAEYRAILSGQLQAMAGMDNEDEIELTIDHH